MTRSETEKRTMLRRLLMAAFCFAAVFMLFNGSRVYADGGDLVISGPEDGYSYANGVLSITKGGTYEISMAEGKTTSTDRINIVESASISDIVLKLTDITLENTAGEAVLSSTPPSESPDYSLTLQLNGNNKFASSVTNSGVIEFRGRIAMVVEGPGKLTVSTSTANTHTVGTGSGSSSVTINSGTLKTEGQCLDSPSVFVNGGLLDITSVKDGIYALSQYKQTGGEVKINCAGNGLTVTGLKTNVVDFSEPEDGLVVEGGTLTVNATGNKSYGLLTGYGSTGSNGSRKNIVINTPESVSITTPTTASGGQPFGVLAWKGDLTVKKGVLKIVSFVALYTNSQGKLFMDGGELEAIGAIAMHKIAGLVYDDGYVHKNYYGTNINQREETSDADFKEAVVGKQSKGYALITPAWPITYDLDGGELEEGKPNPELYSRVDQFTLNNPVKDNAEFLGWTGTDLDEPTTVVTRDKDWKGAREYLANWENYVTIKYTAATGGSVNPAQEIVGESATAEGSVAVPDQDYEFDCWKNEDGESVSRKAAFVPEKVGGKNVAATYIACFVKAGSKIIDHVEVKDGTYDGTEQLLVPDTDKYTVTGGSATRAGTHTATVTPVNGYTWPDGSTGSRTVTYKVRKAVLTAQYTGETIAWYDTPRLPVRITGFVGGETEETARGYKAPIVRKPDYQPHKTYTVKPQDGRASDYKFKYVAGKLKVKCRAVLVLAVKDGSSRAALTWNAVEGATEYRVFYARCDKKGLKYPFTRYRKKIKGRRVVVKGLDKDTYKFYVVAYRVKDGKKQQLAKSEYAHSIINDSKAGYGNAVKVTVNRTNVTVKAGKTAKIKGKAQAKAGRKLLWKKHVGRKVRYISSDKHIATVSKKGRIRGVRKGSCTIYAVAPNGLNKKVTVTVK